jgi:putative copper resistance protein D
VSEALIFCRFAHFASTMALFGATAFLGFLAPSRLVGRLDRTIRTLGVTMAIFAVATAVAWLLLEAGEMGEGWGDVLDPGVVASVLSGTAFGRVWIGRLALGAVLAGLVILAPTRRRAAAILSGLFLATLGLIDHASMREGAMGVLERLNQAAHLTCGGFWVGSLPPLLFSLPCLRDAAVRREAGVALRRFSRLGHFAVAGIFVTGAVNTTIILGRLPIDLASPYQLLLDVKIAVVVAMTAIALFNRYLLVPRLAISPESSLRALVETTIVEIVLGGAVLALVSAFATFEPR